tara:strand:- start:326 stop:790 length:465 start_codon:yes stop_codon:yes gene_type:complete
MFRESRKSYPDWFMSSKLEIRRSPIAGLGVFTNSDMEAHELIESAPVVLFHRSVFETVNTFFEVRTTLMDYPFAWNNGQLAISQGYGGMYNHSTYEPSVLWKCNYELPSLEFYTRRKIKAGEELFIRYVSVNRCDNLWFVTEEDEKLSNSYLED